MDAHARGSPHYGHFVRDVQSWPVPRKLRIEYPGAVYHVMNRGDRRENIFLDDEDREGFMAALGEACGKTEWQVHAHCLMGNHFHLVMEMPQANLVAGMKWLLGVYTKRFNIRHKFCGHVFAGRYRALTELRRREESGMDYRQIERGWCLGGEDFRRELIEAAAERVGPQHYGVERRVTGEQKAASIVLAEMEALGWNEGDLKERLKGDPDKVRIARRLRRETTMSLQWIARRLRMGSWTYVSSLVRQPPKPPSSANSED